MNPLQNKIIYKNKLDETLPEEYKRLKEFHEIAPEGITVINVRTYKFVDFNQNALDFLHLNSDEIKEHGPLTMSPEFQPDGRRSDEKAAELIQNTLDGANPIFEWLVKIGNGELAFFEVRLAKLSEKNGDQRVHVSFVNIEERKKAERKIHIQQSKLTEIGFLQSHQVRQPVASILGLASLFNFKNPSDPLNAELLLKIKTATTQFDDIIKDIIYQTASIETLTLGCKQKGGRNICEPNESCNLKNGCFAPPDNTNALSGDRL